jgi:hypothetical protein
MLLRNLQKNMVAILVLERPQYGLGRSWFGLRGPANEEVEIWLIR